MGTLPQQVKADKQSALAAGSGGLREVFLQSLTYISAGTSLALVLPFVVVFAGEAPNCDEDLVLDDHVGRVLVQLPAAAFLAHDDVLHPGAVIAGPEY
jgi:hypothetical protein